MPFFLLIAGIILIVAAYRKKHGELFALIKEDFFGDNNFVMWSLSIVLLISLGYVKQLKPITDAFLVLIILVIIVRNYRDNKDILSMFIEQVKGSTGDKSTGSHATGAGMIQATGISAAISVGQNVINEARNRLKGIRK